MNPNRRGVVNGGALLLLIILIVLTVIFSVFLVVRVQDSQAVLEGDPDHDMYTPTYNLKTLRSEVNEKQDAIDRLQKERDVAKRYIEQLDHQLLAYKAYYNDATNEWVSLSCGRPGAAETDQLAQGAWHLVWNKVKNTRDRFHMLRRMEDAMAERGYPALEDQASTFRQKASESLQFVTSLESQWNEDRRQLRDRLDEYDLMEDKLEQEYRVELTSRLNTITRLEARIRELLELRLRWLTDIEPDGRIARADPEHAYMIINLGSADGIFRGLRFQVFQYVKGQSVDKGMIEVTQVSADCATCVVLEQTDARDNSMIRGDLIGNPIFSPRQPKTFYLAGDFQKYNKSNIADFIEQMGGRAVQELVPSTNFIVAGENSEQDQDAAREYQVLAMTEETLLKFLTTRFGALSEKERAARAEREAERRSQEESRREMERALQEPPP